MNGRPSITAGVTTLAVAVASAAAYLAMNDWFGAGDLRAMVFWSIPLAVVAAVASRLLIRPTRVGFRYLMACVIGLFAGLLWSVTATFVLGPWIFAFSFPVYVCWIVAGIAGLIVAVWIVSAGTTWIALACLLLVAVGTGRSFQYFLEAPPRVVLYLKEGITEREIQTVWNDVLGETHPGREGHDLKDPISGVSRYVREERVVLEVSFWKGHAAARQRLLSAVAASPHIARIERVDPAEPAKVRASVEY